MEDKILDFRKSAYELCTDDPGIANVLEKIGFRDIAKPGMLVTAGRFMTIPKSARWKRSALKP